MFDVVAIGELLIDFTPIPNRPDGPIFKANPGGAPANVVAGLSRFGKRTAFVGKVGEDEFGDMLAKTLQNLNVDICGLTRSKEANTKLTFVHLDDEGDRSFTFYRKPGADTLLRSEEIDFEMLGHTRTCISDPSP